MVRIQTQNSPQKFLVHTIVAQQGITLMASSCFADTLQSGNGLFNESQISTSGNVTVLLLFTFSSAIVDCGYSDFTISTGNLEILTWEHTLFLPP